MAKEVWIYDAHGNAMKVSEGAASNYVASGMYTYQPPKPKVAPAKPTKPKAAESTTRSATTTRAATPASALRSSGGGHTSDVTSAVRAGVAAATQSTNGSAAATDYGSAAFHPSYAQQLATSRMFGNASSNLRTMAATGEQIRANMAGPSRRGSMPVRQMNPQTGLPEKRNYTWDGQEASSPMEQSLYNDAHRREWEETTEEGNRSRKQRLQREFNERMSAIWQRTGVEDNTADIWSAAEARFRPLADANADREWSTYAALGGGREMGIISASMNRMADEAARMSVFDLEGLFQQAWDGLGQEGQHQLTEYCREALRRYYPEADELDLHVAAGQMARQQSDMRMYRQAVKMNMPKGTLDFLRRKIWDANLVNSLTGGMARSKAGTTGDLAAREAAMGIYGSEHKAMDFLGTVGGFAADPSARISGGFGTAVGKMALGGAGRMIATNAGKRVMTGAATRMFAPTTYGKLLSGMVGGAANFGAFEAIKEGENQWVHGGEVIADDESITGYHVGDYSAGAVGKKALHGAMMGAAVGWISPMTGNVSDKLVRATESTVGKVGVRGLEHTVSTLAEGTIFSVPEWIEGERDAWDVWTDNVAMMAGFKGQHAIKSAPRMIAHLAGTPEGRTGIETRLRQYLDGRYYGGDAMSREGDLSLSKDERAELERYGYDLKKLCDEPRWDVIPGADGEPTPWMVSRLQDLMTDPRVSESARAKMYYYATGRRVPMSTVMDGEMEESADGKGFTVRSLGANGVITSRTYASRKAADLELGRIGRQVELNRVEIGEQYRQRMDYEKRLRDACRQVARDNGWDAVEVYRLCDEAHREALNGTSKEYDEAARDILKRVAEAIGEYKASAVTDGIRLRIDEHYGVDTYRALAKEPERRSADEKAAVEEYIRALMPEGERSDFDDVEYTDMVYQKLLEGGDPSARNTEDAVADSHSARNAEGAVADKGAETEVQVGRPAFPAEGEPQAGRPAFPGGSQDAERPLGRAVMKAGDREVDVISGRVVMMADGSMVDKDASDTTIVIRDTETGEKSMVSVNDILRYEDWTSEQTMTSAAEGNRRSGDLLSQEGNRRSGDLLSQAEGNRRSGDLLSQEGETQVGRPALPEADGRGYGRGEIVIRGTGGATTRGWLTGYLDDMGAHEYVTEDRKVRYATDEELDESVVSYTPAKVTDAAGDELAVGDDVVLGDGQRGRVLEIRPDGGVSVDFGGRVIMYNEDFGDITGAGLRKTTTPPKVADGWEDPVSAAEPQDVVAGDPSAHNAEGAVADSHSARNAEGAVADNPVSGGETQVGRPALPGEGEPQAGRPAFQEEGEPQAGTETERQVGTEMEPQVGRPALPEDTKQVGRPALPGEERTPLQRVPVDEGGEPVFEQVDHETAWDALVEYSDGDAATAKEIADAMAKEKKKVLERAQRLKIKGKTPAEMLASKRANAAELAKAQADYDQWQLIAGVRQSRAEAKAAAELEAKAAADAERRRQAAERAAAEAAERAAREEADRIEREALGGVPEWHHDTPENARARGFRRFNGQKWERQEPLPADIPGKETVVAFSNKAEDLVKGRRIIVDLAKYPVQPSHIQGERNPLFFIEEGQPKNRTDDVSKMTERTIAENIRPKEITLGETGYVGEPKVNSRLEVVQGNNRMGALLYLWDNNLPEQQKKYREHLQSIADEYATTPENVAAMEKPAAITVLDVDDAEAIRLGQLTAQDTESGSIERIKARNVAQKLGDNMRTYANMLLRSEDEEATFGQLVDRNGVDVLKWMGQIGAITPTQYQSAFDSRGNLTAEAKNDLGKVLYQAVFKGANQQLEEMFDKLPAKAQRAILSTAFRDLDSPFSQKMLGEIQASVLAYAELMTDPNFVHAKKLADVMRVVEDWKQQQVIDDRSEMVYPSDNYSNFALHLAAMYKATDYSQRSIADRFNRMYDLIQGMVKPNLLNPNPDNTPRSMADAIKEILGIDYQPAKNSIENGGNGSDAMAVGDRGGRSGRPGGSEPPASGEPAEGGERGAERGAGAADDSADQGNTLGANRDRALSEWYGTVYTGFEGKSAEAEALLRDKCEGVVKGALTYPGIQPIDLAWGDIKAGYMKIVIKHPEVVGKLQDILDNSKITAQSDNRIVFESERHKLIVSKQKGSTPTDNWLLTAYEKKEKPVSASSSDIETEPKGKQNGTATLQNELTSVGKGSNFAGDKQGEGGKSFVQQALGAQPRGDGGWLSGEGYTIAPKPYTNRQGKTLDTYLVTFDRDFSKEEMSALRAKAKAVKGWYDREAKGWMLRSAEDARAFAEDVMSKSEDEVADEAPLSIKDTIPAPKPTVKRVDINGVADALRKKGSTKLSDHAEPITDKTPKRGEPLVQGGMNRAETEARLQEVEEQIKDLQEKANRLEQEVKSYAKDKVANIQYENSDVALNGVESQIGGLIEERDALRVDIAEFDKRDKNPDVQPKPGDHVELKDGTSGDVLMRHHEQSAGDGEDNITGYTLTDGRKVKPEDIAQQGQQPEPKKRPEPGRRCKWISDEDAAEFGSLMDDLRRELGGGDIVEEPGAGYGNKPKVKPMNAEVLRKGVIVTYMMMKGGLRKFSDYCEAMVDELGDAIRPHLKSLYAATKMMEEVMDAGWDEEMDKWEAVKAFDVYTFDKSPVHSGEGAGNPSPHSGEGAVTGKGAVDDYVTMAERVSDEQASVEDTERIIKQLKDQRNEQRRKEADETSANTAAIVDEAEAAASEVGRSTAGIRTEEEAEELIERIDKNLEAVNKQLALLGYYEADPVDKDYNEAYGYMRNAERKATQDAHKLATQIATDLGLTIDTKDKVKKGKNRNFGSKLVSSNVAPAGGEVNIRLPLNAERELYIRIALDPVDETGDMMHETRDDLQVTGIMYRVEGKGVNASNNFADPETTYDDFLADIKRIVRHYLPKEGSDTALEAPRTGRPHAEAEGEPQVGRSALPEDTKQVGRSALPEDTKQVGRASLPGDTKQVGRASLPGDTKQVGRPALPGEDYLDMAERVSEASKPKERTVKPEQRMGSLFDDIFGEQEDAESEMETAFVEEVSKRLGREKMNITTLRKIAKDVGLEGRIDTDLQELTELAIVNRAREIAKNAPTLRDGFNQIVELYKSQPTISQRSSERVAKQQYSTPIPLGYMADAFINVIRPKRVLEPSGGNGMMIHAIEPGKVHANDIDKMRLKNLRRQGFAKVTDQDGREAFKQRHYDAIVTNPPFGQAKVVDYDGFPIAGLEKQMSINALNSMRDDGRAAIIIGGNTEYDEKGRIKGADRIFFNYLYSRYNVVDVININGEMYSRQGTSYPVRMILIDGRRPYPAQEYAPRRANARAEQVTTFDELFNRINDELLRSEELSKAYGDSRGEQGGRSISESGDSRADDASRPDTSVSDNDRERRKSDTAVGGHSAEHGNGTRPATGGTRRSGGRGESVDGSAATERPGRSVSAEGKATGRAADTSDRGNVVRDRGRSANATNVVVGAGDGTGRVTDSKRLAEIDVERQQRKEDKARRESSVRRTLDENPDVGAVEYISQSNALEIGSTVPANQAQPISKALKRIGDVDEFVRQHLGYADMGQLYAALSAEQIDSVALAITQMANSKGFIIGDMTGVGKGRQAAAIIRWAVKAGHKPIFMTEKANLFSDIYRDLTDIGSGELRPLIINAGEDADITDSNGEVVHRAPRSGNKALKRILESGKIPDEYDFVIMTYSQLNAKDMNAKKTFFMKIAAGNYLVMDESHNAGGDGNTGTFLQNILSGGENTEGRPVRGVTFLSGTFAKRPDNMPIYALKTDIGNSGLTAEEMIQTIIEGGVPLQEIMSRALASSGQMVRRERDFTGVTVDWTTIGNRAEHERQEHQYDSTIGLFNRIIQFQEKYVKPIIEMMDAEIAAQGKEAGGKKGTKKGGVDNQPLFSKTFLVTRQLMFAMKADAVADMVIEQLRQGKKPVVAVDNTMESFADNHLPNTGEFDMPTIAMSYEGHLESCMQYTVKDAQGHKSHSRLRPGQLSPEGRAEYNKIIEEIHNATDGVFLSPIDRIKSRVRAAGYSVAELTGRKYEIQETSEGRYSKVSRTDTDKKKSARDFNNGEVDVLILNKSASTGISLHSSKQFGDQRQRVMIIAQPQLDVNTEVQMRGRIDRTGQIWRGHYIYAMCSIPAESRLIMMLKAKLKSLDANTKSSQKSEVSDDSIVDFLNKYGDEICLEYLKEHRELADELYDPLHFEGKEEGEIDAMTATAGTASQICGRVALLSSARQREFYDEIGRLFTDKINYLNEIGENELVISSLPLAAETKATRVFQHGKDPGKGNEFAEDSIMEECEVNVLRKPLKMAEIQREQERLTDGYTNSDEYKRHLHSVMEEHKAAEIALLNERLSKKLADAKARKEASIRKEAEKLAKKSGREIDEAEVSAVLADAIATVEKEHAEKADKMLKALNNRYEAIHEQINSIQYFDTCTVPNKIGIASSGSVYAYVIGVKIPKTGTKLTLICATLDGRRKVEIPFRDAWSMNNVYQSKFTKRLDPLFPTVSTWDTSAPTATRETMYIATGNLLQAYPRMAQGSKIVNFTDKDGNIRQGIIMPKWAQADAGKLMTNTIEPFENVGKAIVEDKKTFTDTHEEVTLGWNQRQWAYELVVPKSKTSGGKYYLDEGLKSLLEWGGNFQQRRNSFVAVVKRENVAKVAKYLSDKFKLKAYVPIEGGVSEPEAEYLAGRKKIGNFASRYETQDGKTISYTSESPEGYALTADAASTVAPSGGKGAGSSPSLGDSRATRSSVQRKNSALLATQHGRLGEGEYSHIERIFRESNAFEFTSGEKIRSAADVAFIFNQLESKNIENAFAVLVKGGRPTVVHLSMGTFNATMVNAPVVKEAVRRIKPDKVYFVHNHPSGELRCSPQDMQSLRNMEKALDMRVEGVIINHKSGKYGTFGTSDPNEIHDKGAAPEQQRRLRLYVMDEDVFAPDYDPTTPPERPMNHEEVAKYISSHRLGSRGKISYLIRAHNGGITANIHSQFTEIGYDNVREIADDIISHITNFGGTSAFIYGDYDYAGGNSNIYATLRNVVRERSGDSYAVLDAVRVGGNATWSAADRGLMEPGTEYGAKDGELLYREVEDEAVLDEFASGKTVKAYRTMQIIDGGLYSPMATKVGGKETPEIRLGVAEQSEEHPEIIKGRNVGKDGVEYGVVVINKGLGKGTLEVAYNPYIHASRTALNDQFTSAHVRPNLVTVEVEIPESELASGYRAESAKNAVGEMPWHSGSVSGQLADLGRPRRVILSRYDKPVRIVPYKEVAEMIAKQLAGTDIEIPYNVVQPQVAEELRRLGVRISDEASGSVGADEDFGRAEYITDEQIAAINARQRAMAETSAEGKRRQVEAMSERLNTPVRIIENVEDINDADAAKQEKMQRAKGWYDPKSGEVVVNLSRNRNVGDVAETMLHEVVAHKGLRELVGEDGYSDFLREVYEHCKADMRKKIADKAADNGWDFEKATDEYLGELSEKGFEDFTEGERSIWQKLKQKVLDAINKLLKGIKLPKWVKLGDNELRYMLWRSHENLRSKPSARNAEGAVADKVADYVEMAADVAKRAELGLDRVNVYRLGDRPETFRSRHEAAVINRGTVMPGLNDARIKVVEGRRHGYMGKDALTQAVRAASQRYDGITMMYDNYGASFEYTIRPRTLKYAANHASESTNNGIHIAVMDILDKVIGESIEVMEHADVHKKEGKRIEENGYTNDTLMHRFVGAVRIGGAVYRVISTLKEYDTNKKPGHHTYEVTKIEVLDTDTPSTSNGTATDEGASVEVAKVIKDCEIHNKTGLKILQESEREDSELLFRDPGETDDIWHDGSLGLEERITNATLRLSNNQRGDLTLRNDAMRAVCDNLQTLLHDMRNRSGRTSSFKGADARVERGVAQSARAQRLYDRVTVKRVADLARVLMQNGYLRDMTSGEMQRIVSALKNTLSHSAHNAEGAVATVEKIMDIMIDNQVRSGSETLKELMSIRGSRVDSRGVEVQGELDADGARMMQAVRRGMKLSETEIQNKIAEAVSRMGDSDQTIADDAALEYAGMQIALDYVQNITGSKNEEKDLRDGLKDAKAEKDAGRMTAEAYNQLVEATEDAIRKNKIERAEAYNALVGRLSDSMRQSIENARAWREAEKRRIQEIQHNANSDMQGMPSDMHRGKEGWKDGAANLMAATAFAPLATFEQMIRGIAGGKAADGEGYLYNRFVRGLNDARANEISGYRGKQKKLDEKVREIFGDGVKSWGDVIRLERRLPKMRVTYFDKSAGEYRDAELMQGNLLYIYMVDKMSDGRMKLRKMGITEDNVDAIADFLDPRIKALGDWLQEEFLVETRNEYNETHKRMFGTSMAAIDNYFPLKILGDARGIQEDIDSQDTIDGATSTITGAIKKRKVNTLALDILGADAFNVVLDHLAEMEHWNAYAEIGRDMNALLSYGKFRNRVKNMRTVYGAGDQLWKRFKDVSRIAFGTYHQEVNDFDEGFLKIARGVTAAKVAFRLNTALKQTLSLPALIPDMSVSGLIEGLKNPRNPFTWCMENLPVFEERWRSRISGDPRLMKSERGWNDWRNNVVEIAGRWGMTPNAFIDAVICSIVAKTIYDTKLTQYLKDGYAKDAADRRAKQDASIGYNLSQQSSEGAYLAPIQAKKNWLSVMFTVFRNSPMSYTRQVVDSLRNLGRNLTPGKYQEMIEYMTKQTLREWGNRRSGDLLSGGNRRSEDLLSEGNRRSGDLLSEGNRRSEDLLSQGNRRSGDLLSQAKDAAKRRYSRTLMRDALRLLTYGFVLPGLWSLGGYWLYMLFGNDDDEKQQMQDDIYARLATAPFEGLTGGDVMSNMAAGYINGTWNENTMTKDMPLTADMAQIARKLLKEDKMADALNDIFNLCVQSGFGFNPATIENAVLGIMDACGNDVQLAHEATIVAARILNCPESQVKKLYFDEIGLSGEEASRLSPAQIAERYARMQVKLGRPIMPWLWDDETAIGKRMKGGYGTLATAKERYERQWYAPDVKVYTDLTARYKAVAAKEKEAKDASKGDYIKSAAMYAELHRDPDYKVYKQFLADDRQLTNLAGKWIESASGPEASMILSTVNAYRSAMVRAYGSTDRMEQHRAQVELKNIMRNFETEYKKYHPEVKR